MVKALFDTNILIDHLRGIEGARTELGRYEDKAISIVTWMEVLVGAPPPAAAATRGFLDSFVVVPIDTAVAERAVALRQVHRVKLPDAIVWASAQAHGRLLVTRDTKGFPSDDPGVRVPYGTPIGS
jgi:predicted nucleic acid-binding protein